MQRVVTLDKRDGLSQDGDVTREDTIDILLGGHLAALAAHEVGVNDGLILDTLGNVKCAVVVRIEILLLVVFYLGV